MSESKLDEMFMSESKLDEMFNAVITELREIRELLGPFQADRLDAAVKAKLSQRNKIGAAAAAKVKGTEWAKERSHKAITARWAKRDRERAEAEQRQQQQPEPQEV